MSLERVQLGVPVTQDRPECAESSVLAGLQPLLQMRAALVASARWLLLCSEGSSVASRQGVAECSSSGRKRISHCRKSKAQRIICEHVVPDHEARERDVVEHREEARHARSALLQAQLSRNIFFSHHFCRMNFVMEAEP